MCFRHCGPVVWSSYPYAPSHSYENTENSIILACCTSLDSLWSVSLHREIRFEIYSFEEELTFIFLNYAIPPPFRVLYRLIFRYPTQCVQVMVRPDSTRANVRPSYRFSYQHSKLLCKNRSCTINGEQKIAWEKKLYTLLFRGVIIAHARLKVFLLIFSWLNDFVSNFSQITFQN